MHVTRVASHLRWPLTHTVLRTARKQTPCCSLHPKKKKKKKKKKGAGIRNADFSAMAGGRRSQCRLLVRGSEQLLAKTCANYIYYL